MEHKCDTCVHEFATCPAKKVTFGIDRDPSARGKEADKVVLCDAYRSDGKARVSFGAHKGERFEDVPESYLAWIIKAYKGGFKVSHPGEVKFCPPERDFLEARRVLDARGWNTRGIDPVKDW